MPKFKKKTQTSQEIPTAALPDIIFMLLFFFMVTTVLRETDILVDQHVPQARELNKLERKSLVSYIYVGKPKQADIFGKEPRVQFNDAMQDVSDIPRFVQQEKDKLDENERDQLTVSLKIDKEVKMGIVVDVQQVLREVNARKILYAASKRVVK
jgi:biopolymer transport protein ExbD